MTIDEKLSALREIMERENIDAYIISGTDPHNSEYLPEAWQQREWISGFTGSFGTVVVTLKDVGLWTDTRYFIQAEKELAGTEIIMHKLRIPEAQDYPEWLLETLEDNTKIGVDSFCMTTSDVKKLKNLLSLKHISIIEKTDLLGEIWLDRPALPKHPLFLLDACYTGIETKEKIQDIRCYLKENNADYILFSCLDEIAWLYNIRGTDIPYNPLVIAYAIIGKEKAWLFVNPSKVSSDMATELQESGIEIKNYYHLSLFLDELIPKDKERFCIDSNTLNYAVSHKIESKYTIVDKTSPVILKKAIKNPVEIEGFRKACLQDGIATAKFFYWLENNIQQHSYGETEIAEKLMAFRKESKDYISDSFHTISAYGKNAALPHYSARPGNDDLLQNRGLYLVDSGAQYWFGTTDITRTIALGELSDLEKEDYTLVLKGMINLSRCVFPLGTTGANIDIIARFSLWNNKRNYGHGTGHGIGHFSCVHEGPQDIRQTLKNQPVLPGMVTSNEPGMYREGFHGVRHENMIVCVPLETNEFGKWHGFETLTLCYFDINGIAVELLNEDEKKWLNSYHQTVYEKISPYLSPEETLWLKTKTKGI